MAFLLDGLKLRSIGLDFIVLVSSVGGVGFLSAKLANPKGQGTLRGMYRWLILSLTAYLIVHWTYLLNRIGREAPDWGEAAQTALESIFPQFGFFRT